MFNMHNWHLMGGERQILIERKPHSINVEEYDMGTPDSTCNSCGFHECECNHCITACDHVFVRI